MSSAENINTEFLPIIYEIIRSIEKESSDATSTKPPETLDLTQKISDLRNKLEQCRSQIKELPGIEYSKEEQLRQLAALRDQVVHKRQLLLKYKNMCHFDKFLKSKSAFAKSHSIIVNYATHKPGVIKNMTTRHIDKRTPKFILTRDHNFDFFRNSEMYQSTVIPKWTQVQLVSFISKFLNSHEIKITRASALYDYLSLEKNIRGLSADEMQDVMTILGNLHFHRWKLGVPLHLLDEKCALCIDDWSMETSLYVFDAWFVLYNHKALECDYYKAILHRWIERFSECTKNHIVQIVYYFGILKTMPESLTDGLNAQLKRYVHIMSAEEWAIVCISLFKTNTKILEEFFLSKTVESAKLLMAANSRFHFISTIKYLRLARCYDKPLLQMLCGYIKKDCGSFNFVECTNFLAAFSSQNVYQKPTVESLEQHAVEVLSKELIEEEKKPYVSANNHPSIRCRMKDMAKFLWGISSVGHVPKNGTIEILLKAVNSKHARGEFQDQPNALVDCLQSLAMMGYYQENLLDVVFQGDFLTEIWNMNKIKPRYQIYFLLKSAQIEYTNWYKKCMFTPRFLNKLRPIPKDIDLQVQERNHFKKLVDLLTNFMEDRVSVRYCYVLSHIPVAGIFVKCSNEAHSNIKPGLRRDIAMSFNGQFLNECGFCIEVLDSHVCARDSEYPLGFMKTKIRQLQKLSFPVHVITSKEIEKVLNRSVEEQKTWVSNWLVLFDKTHKKPV